MIKKLGLFIFCGCTLFSLGQNDDALLWTSTAIKGKINSDFNYEFDLQFRFDENMTNLSSAFLQGTVDYEVGKLVKIAVGYRLSNRDEADNYVLKNRLFTDIDFDYEVVNDLDFEVRLRAQHDYDRLSPLNDFIVPDARTLLRFKYGLQYAYKDWKPSISNEYFYHTTARSIMRYRINFGLGYKLTKRHNLKVGYTFQKNLSAIQTTDHIYKIGYTYDIPGRIIAKK